MDNSGNDSEEVAFVVSEFCGPPGTVPFRPPLRLHPPRFVLGRFESQLVSVRLPLLADLFLPNQRYIAPLTVRKRDPLDLTINVVVRAAPMHRGPAGARKAVPDDTGPLGLLPKPHIRDSISWS